MKIKMLVGIAGTDFALSPNEETDRFSTKEATRMIDAGMAVPVKDDEKVERATKKPAPEKRG
ncbi:hypothetical protein [Chelatococcus sp. YT9]|uniref:hypothetical protein n=1 Tax=Chelatococcus sp. YT9 TaxID=2835635 RepID=UPI001BD11E51|nr:hypothetical protein [Chelatococcus sp. YT9]MBS7696264.1 hypothetical protein [Chelatococcus sp. YT9]